MNTRHLRIVAVIVVLAIISYTFSVLVWMDNLTIGPLDIQPLIDCKVSNIEDYTNDYVFNLTQGSTQQVNFTLASKTDLILTIPLDFRLIAFRSETYNGELDSFIPSNDPTRFRYNETAQDKLFNYAFSHSQLILQPFGFNSTIITLEIADIAPSGFYAFSVRLGNWEVTHQKSWQLDVVVEPKLE
ncbi:MAG: hypothetical protein PVI43_02060 [Candidatus Bathyarchaeota archaeon]|jgi:hypothetical protein